MNEALKNIITDYEKAISQLNQRRKTDNIEPYKKLRITLLGQFSLFAVSETAALLSPVATKDIDALIEGESTPSDVLKKIMRENGFNYDEESMYIWIPPGSSKKIIYDSDLILCEVLDPIYVLLSKAIKAPEKNKLLIQEGISIYADELINLIEAHGGDVSYFVNVK